MKFKLFLFYFFVFLIGFSSAASLSMSPPQLDFVGDGKKVVCGNVLLKVNDSEELIGEIRWARDGYFDRKLLAHNLSSEERGIEFSFPKEVFVEGKRNVNVCVEGKDGDYHGVLLYRVKDKPVQVGIWINASLNGGGIGLTGNFINAENNVGGYMFGIFVFLVLVLIGLGFWYFSKKNKSSVEK